MPPFVPQLLLFPHRQETPIGTVWSERPIPPQALRVAAATVRHKLRLTPLARPDERRSIFLTQGGWRWTWLTLQSRGSFAITRPLSKAIVVNRTDAAGRVVRNGAEIGGERTLGAVLTHEFTHGLIRRHFGALASMALPTWKVEGYCDFVAGESSLTAGDVEALARAGQDHPALPYYHGRRRVEAELMGNGGDVDRLFASD